MGLSPWVATLEDERARVFRYRLGRSYAVPDIDGQGRLVLDVGADIDTRCGGVMDDIRVEPELRSSRPGPRDRVREDGKRTLG